MEFKIHSDIRENPAAQREFTLEELNSLEPHDYYQSMEYQKKNLITIIVCGFILLATIVHMVNWDTHSLRIIPLKTKEILGLVSKNDLVQIARICEDRLKFDCAVKAMTQATLIQATTHEVLSVANLHRKMNNLSDAEYYYNLALQMNNGEVAIDNNLLADIYYGLARINEQQNITEKALQYYSLSLQAKPEVIQITVTEAYINLLKQIGQNETAIAVINEARKRSGSEKLFAGLIENL